MPPQSAAESELKDRYIQSLDCITRHMYAATQRIIEHYQVHQLALDPYDIIRMYSHCFGLTVAHGVTENPIAVLQPFLTTIRSEVAQGEQLRQVMANFKNTGQWQADTLVKNNGVLIVNHASQLIYFIADKTCASLQQTVREYSTDEQRGLNFQFGAFLRTVFSEMIEVITYELEKLQVAIPVAFFLDHFAIFMGWMIGFFANLVDIPLEEITRRITDWIRVTVEIEVVKPAAIH